ncbi:hypothetical protein DdX_21474 [Ditylenchus destructor]|uniref:Uncharacterized protein n=1 Tax=Ditylenchus destructor TaxID=166010 RepID=A0AAD4MGF0_9BILA|nr:hypothetical protein DdX_21474 [Ditylenchus destructor]
MLTHQHSPSFDIERVLSGQHAFCGRSEPAMRRKTAKSGVRRAKMGKLDAFDIQLLNLRAGGRAGDRRATCTGGASLRLRRDPSRAAAAGRGLDRCRYRGDLGEADQPEAARPGKRAGA